MNTANRVMTVLPKNAPNDIISNNLPARGRSCIPLYLNSNEKKKYDSTATIVNTMKKLLKENCNIPCVLRTRMGLNDAVICGMINMNWFLNSIPAPTPRLIPIAIRDIQYQRRDSWKYHIIPSMKAMIHIQKCGSPTSMQ